MSQEEAGMAAAAGILGGATIVFLLVIIALYVLLIIAHWKMFTKAGEAGWKSLIPIYNEYILFKIVWNTKNFLIYLGLGIVMSILMSMSGYSGAASSSAEPNMFVSLLLLVCAIAYLVWIIRLQLKTAAAYGKSTGFGIGLILLPNIFTLILGFGSAQYVGPQE